ncbi:HpcH/HpaI aldolase/citrate lyase family protein [Enterovirga sp.]|jgi:4-hydroxy-2-oxoheptanedioate aldolase|uniref:HpcH/HpaI aldolase/citrate lyase family protein n=1 Tax=Enterovirga sp. TaxID=2026350 RepID=UPI00260ECDB7|nr:HpcH/HpaI aldolase/citrate lyase family protein [Enterovirga sp.]MDB5591543.1 4-hydroxy-2-oxo-heptane,7-dioate aldolase [Enterovirga sp.]
MELQRNAFKAALGEGRTQIGLWSSLCSNIVAEILRDSGFDWILLDTEHSPNELPGLISQMQALAGGSATPIVRPAWNDPVLIKRILDAGAPALLIPFVQNAAEARAAVAATRYPPDGIRGITTSGRAARFGRVQNYLKTAADEICLLVQVETGPALAALEEIASVQGVDGVFIGPSDLAASLGHLGNAAHPEVQDAMRDAVTRLTKLGKPAGILTSNDAEARRYLEWGYRFVAVGSDLGVLARNADALARSFKT